MSTGTPPGIQLHPDVCVVMDAPFLRYLRRELGSDADDLVTYFVPRNGKWCLGVFRDRLSGYVQEIKSWYTEAELTPMAVSFVRYFLSDERRKDILHRKREVLAEDRSDRGDANDRVRDQNDRYRHARRKMNIHRRGAMALRKIYT